MLRLQLSNHRICIFSYPLLYRFILCLQGLLAAMKIIKVGLSPSLAVQMGIVNKTFDVFEKEIVEDVVHTRIPAEWIREDVYE